MVPVELAAMFRFVVVRLAEMLLWLLCMIVSKSCGICNVFDHLICWLWIVYSVCISHIVQWCLVWGFLVVCVKFLGLFRCRCMYDEC